MENEITKIIIVVILVLLIIFIINFDNIDESKIDADTKDGKAIVETDYRANTDINDVLLFDYANLNYQGFICSGKYITINYLETCEYIGNEYLFEARDQNNKKLHLNVKTEKMEYNQNDDLYYTNYYLEVKLDSNVKIINLKINRDNVKYIVKCSVSMFTDSE